MALDRDGSARHAPAVRRIAALLLLLPCLVAGCWLVSAFTPSRPLGPGEYWLPWTDARECEVTSLEGATLHGSPTNGAVWLESPTGGRIELVWPPRFSARFDPDLEVLDHLGRVAAREGTPVTEACLTGDPDVLSLDLYGPA
jgi:hypothetical protein